MPIVERDPWRMQYFERVPCPEDLFISTEDPDSWRLYPEHRWVYDKLAICASQGLECGPHGVVPERWPVFSKPIYNMRGMGIGSRVLDSPQAYAKHLTAGHMWMRLCEGEHVSTDVAVIDGEARWWRHTTAKALQGGMFDYWTVLGEQRPELEAYCGEWLRRHLRGYTGVVNFETIGGTIIECHLRFADQWPDLNGRGWVESLVELYQHRRWSFADQDRRTGYSVVLFGAHGPRYRKPPPEVVDELLRRPHLSSIQITFFEDKPPEQHAMPPGGFRLAIVNCWDLDVGFEVRERLALHFWSTQRVVARRRRLAK